MKFWRMRMWHYLLLDDYPVVLSIDEPWRSYVVLPQ